MVVPILLLFVCFGIDGAAIARDVSKIEARFFCTGFNDAAGGDEMSVLAIGREPALPGHECSLFAVVCGSAMERREAMLQHFGEKFRKDLKDMGIGMLLVNDAALRAATIYLWDAFFRTLTDDEVANWKYGDPYGQELTTMMENLAKTSCDLQKGYAELQACHQALITTHNYPIFKAHRQQATIESTKERIDLIEASIKLLADARKRKALPSLVSLVNVYWGKVVGRSEVTIRTCSFQGARQSTGKFGKELCSYQVHPLWSIEGTETLAICLNECSLPLGTSIRDLLSKDADVKQALKEGDFPKVSEKIALRAGLFDHPDQKKSCTLFLTFRR